MHDRSVMRHALAAALCLGAALVCVAAAMGLRHLIDLHVYLYGADELLAGRSPYASVEPIAQLPFTYPPVAVYLFVPLALLPIALADGLWLSVVVGCAAVIFAILLTWVRGTRPTGLLLATVVGAAFLTEPYFATFGYGQINTVLLAMVVVDAVLVRRESRWAGVLTGIAAAVKLTPAIFVLYWLLTGRWRPAGRAGAVFTALAVVPMLWRPGWAAGYWTDDVFSAERLGWVRGKANQSLLGLVGRWWRDGAYSDAVTYVLFAVALVAGLWLARRAYHAGRDDLGLAVAAVAALLATPASWDHHYVWATPLVVIMLGRGAPRAWRIGALVAVAVFVVWPMQFSDYGPSRPDPPGLLGGIALGSYTLVAVVLLVLVAVELTRLPTSSAALTRASTHERARSHRALSHRTSLRGREPEPTQPAAPTG